jgi:hypothetical protein
VRVQFLGPCPRRHLSLCPGPAEPLTIGWGSTRDRFATSLDAVTEAAPRPTTKRPARFSIRRVRDEPTTSAADIRNQLRVLELERLEAASAGLLELESYRRDLENEMAERRSAFVSAAVIEIARLRAELSAWEAAT